ncbi:transglutaminaseTgpA domain-containing protein [Alteromonas gracilis]|uniref:transglutaminase family protein n=1 Tax=Alteromonas gracilis TaxID=1479524 RepID=UPI0037350FAF
MSEAAKTGYPSDISALDFLKKEMSQPRTTAILLLCTAFSFLLITLTAPLMTWVLVLGGCAVIVRVAGIRAINSLPTAQTVNLLAVLAVFALTWFGFSIGLLDSMINLLTIACSLKVMQVDNKRDFHLLICASLFLIGCGFISSLSIFAWFGYTGLVALLLCSTAIYHGASLPITTSIKFVSLLVAQALPIALLLFLLLPQLPPLWQMPTSKSTETGLSDTVTPGDIASLATSSKLAFSAAFESSEDVPETAARYWRAMTLEHFDGRTWSISPKRKQAEAQLAFMDKPSPLSLLADNYTGVATSYELIVEPTQQTWLFAMAPSLPNNQVNNIFVKSLFDFTLRANTPITSKKAFYFRYLPNANISNGIGDFETQINLQVSMNGNPKTREWGQSLAKQYASKRDIVNAVMQAFRENGFRYTLSPNAMPTDPIDRFLFEERAGFCAHYAGAMVYALRAANVPARMVTGYQGGSSLNENVLQIRQYDAHAWVEVLIDGIWLRYDPTSMVAPSRLTLGLERALEELGESRQPSILNDLSNSALFATLQSWFQQLDYSWSKWVLGFDDKAQTSMLEDILGALTPHKMRMVYLFAFGVIGLVLAFYFLPNRHKAKLPLSHQILFQAVEQIEQKTGVKREHKTLAVYQNEITPQLKVEASSAFCQLCRQFERINYLPDNDKKAELLTMKQQLKALKQALK